MSASETALSSPHQAFFAAAMCGVLGFLLYQGVVHKRRVAFLPVLWYLATLVPLSTGGGVLANFTDGRKLYSAGPAMALVLALSVAPAIETLIATRWQAARAALLAACIGAVLLAGSRVIRNERPSAVASEQAHSFLINLRETYPDLPTQTNLFVINAPLYLEPFFGPLYLQALVGLYYDDVTVFVASEETLPPLQPGDIVFRYGQDRAASPP